MKLTAALRVGEGSAVAIVGAGGKTSLMFALANALPKPVCLTTTTKLSIRETAGKFRHRTFAELMKIGAESFAAGDTLLVTNAQDESKQKWLGLSTGEADLLLDLCREKGAACLIEADGARRCSLKAPADWEPVIPTRADHVLVVAGLSVIGKPFSEAFVFRPEIFSQLTGLRLGEPIRLEHILRALSHPRGGLKGIPPGSRAVAVFNQADAVELAEEERELIRQTLATAYSGALLTALRRDPTGCDELFHLD